MGSRALPSWPMANSLRIFSGQKMNLSSFYYSNHRIELERIYVLHNRISDTHSLIDNDRVRVTE